MSLGQLDERARRAELEQRLRARIAEYQRVLASGLHLTDAQMTHYRQCCDALEMSERMKGRQ